jgi:hypothetical protein
MRTIRWVGFTASILLLSAFCLVASAEEVKSKADEVQSNAMADMVWYQFKCTKCGYEGSKIQTSPDVFNRTFKNMQQECWKLINGNKCGGLKTARLCSPPG